MSNSLPQTVHIDPPGGLLSGIPDIPGAKYLAVRVGIVAALANGTSRIMRFPRTDDTAVLCASLQQLGVTMQMAEKNTLEIAGCNGIFPNARKSELIEIDAGNAGAVLRLLLGVTAAVPAIRFTTAHHASLGIRPNGDLLAALQQLGVEVQSTGNEGLLPIELHGKGIHGGTVSIVGKRSSQYISALLLLAPTISEGLDISITDGVSSASFIRLTIEVMRSAGIQVDANADLTQISIAGNQTYTAKSWQLAGDFPTAATWLAFAAVAGENIQINHLDADMEDGRAVRAALQRMGANFEAHITGDGSLSLTGHGSQLHGCELDGGPIIDSVPILAAAACFAEGKTTFSNVAPLRLKESNRIDALCKEFNRAGAQAIAGPDSITIVGNPSGIIGGTTVDAHADHRLIMALSLLAQRSQQGLTITGAHHIAKSYPQFFEELRSIGGSVV